MADLDFDIDVEGIAEKFGKLKERVKEDLTKGVESLAKMTHAKTLELAKEELGSLSQTYMDNVEWENPEENLWVVTLKNPAMWIEEGRKGGFMEELLNGKSSDVGADGKRYAVIPFKHNTSPSQQSPKAQELANQIKQEMKRRGVDWKKIEYDEDGSPRIGRLHRFNMDTARAKPQHKYPLTHGVSVYQKYHDVQQKDGSVKQELRRDVVTFRTISEKHEREGLWMHPGREGAKILDEAFDWAVSYWESNILPEILKEYE